MDTMIMTCGTKISRFLCVGMVLHTVLLAAAVASFADDDAHVVTDAAAIIGISASVSPDSVTVGDLIEMSVSLTLPEGAQVIPPETGRGFGDFIVLADTVVADTTDSGALLYQYRLAIFKPEDSAIPPLAFLVGADTLYDTLFTQSFPIAVVSVIPPDAPEGGWDIMDLKDQQKTGGADLRFLWVIAAIAVAALTYYLFRKYLKGKSEDEIAARLKPPYDEAIEAIIILEEKRYLERGAVREYAFELSEIFKRYIGRRYGTGASELTSEEIIDWLGSSPIGVDMRLCAERFFRTSDQVKFAKWKPDQNTVDGFMKDVKAFLQATKPEPEPQNGQTAENAGGAG